MKVAGLVAVAMLATACPAAKAPPAGPGAGTVDRPPTPLEVIALHRLRGAWRWLHVTEEDGTLRIERERWLLGPITIDPETRREVLPGRYRRDLTVLALDGRAFVCNQRAAYVQSAIYDVVVATAAGQVEILEASYRTEPSPCEHGFRHLGRYVAQAGPHAAVLRWEGGEQTLERLGDDAFTADDLELHVAVEDALARYRGAWHWTLRSRDDDGNVRDEDEAWDLAIGDDGIAGGSYQRVVTVHSGDGADLPCAGAPSYRFVDRYTVRGKVVDDLLSFDEVTVDAGSHPCLAATPTRHLDAATGTTEGDHLILTWRGKRRQVLHRE